LKTFGWCLFLSDFSVLIHKGY